MILVLLLKPQRLDYRSRHRLSSALTSPAVKAHVYLSTDKTPLITRWFPLLFENTNTSIQEKARIILGSLCQSAVDRKHAASLEDYGVGPGLAKRDNQQTAHKEYSPFHSAPTTYAQIVLGQVTEFPQYIDPLWPSCQASRDIVFDPSPLTKATSSSCITGVGNWMQIEKRSSPEGAYAGTLGQRALRKIHILVHESSTSLQTFSFILPRQDVD